MKTFSLKIVEKSKKMKKEMALFSRFYDQFIFLTFFNENACFYGM